MIKASALGLRVRKRFPRRNDCHSNPNTLTARGCALRAGQYDELRAVADTSIVRTAQTCAFVPRQTTTISFGQHNPTQSYAFKACRLMFSIIGAAGLWSIQHWGHRDELQEAAKAAVKSALKVGNRNPRLSSSSDRHSASVDSTKSSHQQHQGRSCNVRDGAFVCFKDRTGQVAVIQPYGNGGSWQLTVTCASGGCCLLPEGKRLFLVSIGTNDKPVSTSL